MKTLDLVLKHKWFDMIASGQKKEEYRDIRPFWTKRFIDLCSYCEKPEFVYSNPFDCLKITGDKYIQVNFDKVRFHRGYSSQTMVYEVRNVFIGFGNSLWGAEQGKKYYVIRLGNRLSKTL